MRHAHRVTVSVFASVTSQQHTDAMVSGEPAQQQSPRFPDTRWSMVFAAADSDSSECAGALAQMCRCYWYPVFAYLRGAGHSIDAAQDLTQGFFLHLIENRTIHRADQLRGTFRGFLIGCLKHFEANERDRERAAKRGGHVKFVPFDPEAAERLYSNETLQAPPESPDTMFDRRWARVIVQRALDRLSERYQDNRRLFERLTPFLTTQDAAGSYDLVARELSVSVPMIKSAIHRMRRQYARTLRQEVALTVSAPHEMENELHYLAAVLTAD